LAACASTRIDATRVITLCPLFQSARLRYSLPRRSQMRPTMKRPAKPLVIVADDDPAVLRWMEERLRGWDCRLACVRDKKDLLRQLAAEVPSLLLLALFFGEHDGIELMQQLLREHHDLTVVLLTGHGTIESAVSAIRLGAFDYLSKPLDLNRLRVIL